MTTSPSVVPSSRHATFRHVASVILSAAKDLGGEAPLPRGPLAVLRMTKTNPHADRCHDEGGRPRRGVDAPREPGTAAAAGPVTQPVATDRPLARRAGPRIYVTNKLPAPTTVHWHGMILPNGMDGVAGLTQRTIRAGETFKYEFTLRQPGTFMYHPHYDEMTQMALGMMGMFVIHPRRRSGPRSDRDFALMLHEWRIDVGSAGPTPTR